MDLITQKSCNMTSVNSTILQEALAERIVLFISFNTSVDTPSDRISSGRVCHVSDSFPCWRLRRQNLDSATCAALCYTVYVFVVVFGRDHLCDAPMENLQPCLSSSSSVLPFVHPFISSRFILKVQNSSGHQTFNS